MAFNLGNEEGFHWIDGYDNITANELLCGGASETKTDVAEELIRDMLSSGEFVPAEQIFAKAQESNISKRTINEAKLKIKGLTTRRIGKGWSWAIPDNADEAE